LYGVSLRDPEKVTGYIFMLSGLLRYQVEGSKKERVDLSDELRFIEQFVAYEKLKLGHRGDIKLQIDVVDSSLVIAPLILFQFIENAFKFSGLKVQPRVLIQIFLRDNKIYFECTNSFDKELREKSDGTRTSMINVCQRLELQYPLQHSLRINESEQEYNVQLEIELTDGKI
jgi:LytS/YehU family sensor histidine kinase